LLAKPFDARPFDASPLEARPLEARPLLAKPFDARPLLAKPFDARPLLARPFDAKPLLAKPFDAKPFDASVWLATGLDASGLALLATMACLVAARLLINDFFSIFSLRGAMCGRFTYCRCRAKPLHSCKLMIPRSEVLEIDFQGRSQIPVRGEN
jgi:hypothetical protein